MACCIVLLFLLPTCAGFKVSTPTGQVVAVRGQPAILGCEFTPDSDLSYLVVTWQRVEDSRVVHSYYYNRDQLNLQCPDYRDRTSLFVSELLKGNATLRIEPVNPVDVGKYICTVSNSKGTDKAQVQLWYGAFYTEPSLSINISYSSITLLYEAKGFPKPEVQWLGEHGEDLSDHMELSDDADGAVGLYHLRSSYVSNNSSLKVTFTLKNPLLNQDLRRSVNITYGGEKQSSDDQWSIMIFTIILAVLCVLLFTLFAYVIKMKKAACYHSPAFTNSMASQENGHEKASCTEDFIPQA